MSERNDGGPAFPVAYGQGRIEGMTLRDYFAATWLNGFVANPKTVDLAKSKAARVAYEVADAMLRERIK